MMTRDEILALPDLLARATKGPWRTAKNDPCRVLGSAGTMRVCHAFSSVMRDEIDEANAALAAKAPAMAETLLAMQAELDAERAARENLEAELASDPLTADQLADALRCFWNAALGSAREHQGGYELASIMAEGIAAVQIRLMEIAKGTKND